MHQPASHSMLTKCRKVRDQVLSDKIHFDDCDSLHGDRLERRTMGRAAREITDTELSILNLLWQWPMATTQVLTVALYSNTTASLLATVRKLLDRLEAEGVVLCDRTQWPHHYTAILKRDELAVIWCVPRS
jgi:hypothetical protein